MFEGLLFKRYEDVDFFLSIHAELVRPGNIPNRPNLVNVTSMMSSVASDTTPGMPDVDQIQLVWSCLARGTQILMADGSLASIEDIGADHQVMGNGAGWNFGVIDTSTGIEDIPMVRLQDDMGHSVLMTESHPVVTAERGVLWAEELKVGDKVMTESGVSTLVAVEREDYRGSVHNLKLDPGAYADEMPYQSGSTMFANGFLVGDLAMQRALEFKNQADFDANVLDRLPAAWHTDYQNSQRAGSTPQE